MDRVAQSAHLAGRKLLGDTYHCSGSDTLLGSANVGASIFILLLIGFLVGFALSWLVWWRREKRRDKIEMEYRDRFAAEGKAAVPDVSAWIKAANTPTIKSPAPGSNRHIASEDNSAAGAPTLQLPTKLRPRTATSGPLGLGVSESMKREPLRHTPSGNPFSDVESYNVLSNPVSSLNNSPIGGAGDSVLAHSHVVNQGTGLIGALYRPPASDPASPQLAARAPQPNPDPTRSDAAWGADSIQHLPPAKEASTFAAQPSAAAAGLNVSTSSDYAAALGRGAGPLATDLTNQAAGLGAGGQAAAAEKVKQKSVLLQQVREQEYNLEELDSEWQELLGELNANLAARGQPALNSKETAVAIRSLIVSTSSQSADVAIKNAFQEILSYRRMHA